MSHIFLKKPNVPAASGVRICITRLPPTARPTYFRDGTARNSSSYIELFKAMLSGIEFVQIQPAVAEELVISIIDFSVGNIQQQPFLINHLGFELAVVISDVGNLVRHCFYHLETKPNRQPLYSLRFLHNNTINPHPPSETECHA